jgi:hypothetical protein
MSATEPEIDEVEGDVPDHGCEDETDTGEIPPDDEAE